MSADADPWPRLRETFPDLPQDSWPRLQAYAELLREWNGKVNLVSRKDADRIETKHLYHCLAITKILRLMPKARVLDVGTGGGLPGIPLAICHPQARFTLLDSVAKKVAAVENMVRRLRLANTEVMRGRAEELPNKRSYDFVLGRAVTALPTFFGWVRGKIRKGARHAPANGILYLKGGDYEEELRASRLHPAKVWNLQDLVPEFQPDQKYLLHFKA